ncbi:MAG: hypothetical protein NC930_08075 [Candidatus Omnitrophica bacterium]|nr:hypothetical protein [Candidatus Omnitrophota bacterium]
MPNAVIAPSCLTPLAAYPSLKKRVQKVLLGGQQRIEADKVRTYWKTGWLIDAPILRHQTHADFGEKHIQRISKDLGLVSGSFIDVFKLPKSSRK